MKAKQHKPPWPPAWAALPDDAVLERLSRGDAKRQLPLPLDLIDDRQRDAGSHLRHASVTPRGVQRLPPKRRPTL